MTRSLAGIFLAVTLVVLPLAILGCKGKVERPPDEPRFDMNADFASPTDIPQETRPPIEPAENVATETIPPTAAPEITKKPMAIAQEAEERARQIQTALKNAGFYTGAIDGKIGPRSKQAIEEFQRAKGLKADGIVGPRTWAELEKYLE